MLRVFAVVLAVLLVAGGGFSAGHWGFPGHRTASSSAKENVLFQQAFSLQSEGHLQKAQTIYRRILQLDPLNSYAYYDLGLIYQDASDTTDATTAYEKALLIQPDYQPAIFNLASIETLTAPQAAIALYQQLQKLPNLSHADAVAFNLGLLLLENGQTAEGYSQLAYAVRLTPALQKRIPAKYLPIPQASGTTGTP